jgi:hypothetical protein
MTMLCTNPLTDFESLIFRGPPADVVTWQGRRALRLNGLVIVPDLTLDEGSLEVQIGSDGAAYPGLVFRAADILNYELAYAQPHTSGQWDALQYDPVFHGVNTWQLRHGAGAQPVATAPSGSWFTFKIDFKADLESPITPGTHTLTAKLKMTEPFGWGMRLSVRGGQFSWLPAELG